LLVLLFTEEATISGGHYLDILQTFFISELRRYIFGVKLLRAILCSVPHYETHTAWPPRSPDFTPLDILWGHVKTLFTKVTFFELTAPKFGSYSRDRATGKSFN
jgi:hypothetical protein